MTKFKIVLSSFAVITVTAATVFSDDIEEMVAPRAFAITGDSIMFDAKPVRLYGVVAPDIPSICYNARDERFWCGKTSKAMLDLILNKYGTLDLDCIDQGPTEDGTDRRFVSCFVEIEGNELTTLGKLMVGSGSAYADTDQTYKYVTAENYARDNKLGLWEGWSQQQADLLVKRRKK